ncbi:hypothetical protein B0T10DRAFT_485478 [Thelonectria olida]|uniref:Heterokaryon incompatibility domain-containing protein n=1 Tax=Thelonectria olida TaxID=1576542 RepID=A0A9P9AQU2_9HYPO|nr:hypothetical protein B0T10DRAFT_485478 [Thelonectria olida]
MTAPKVDIAASGKCILEVPFSSLTAPPISISSAQPCRFRLVDCRSFKEGRSLRILEFNELPASQYATISYVWRGLQPTADVAQMIIDGTDKKGRISVDVLRIACGALLELGCELLWVDGLCIIQGNETDKGWQMQRMYDIYKSCAKCLVVPGGLLRLAELPEETSWIHRAWTLQEAIAPPSAECLFSWTAGECILQSNMSTAVHEVEKGVAAIANMKSLLETSMSSRCAVIKEGDEEDSETEVEVKILGNGSQLQALLGALDLRGVAGFENAVWRSSFTRTAKYAVDNVYAIMGVLGVTLNTLKFGQNDRVPATIELMQALLDKGHQAEWLAIATKMENNPSISTIPVFPEPSPAGKAVVKTEQGEVDVSSLMDGWWMIADTPKGVLDSAGYLEFNAPAASIKKASPGASNPDTRLGDDADWEVLPTHEGPFYAVFVGTKQPYLNGVAPWISDPNDCVLMLLEEHLPGKFHSIGYVFASKAALESQAWSAASFMVGPRA